MSKLRSNKQILIRCMSLLQVLNFNFLSKTINKKKVNWFTSDFYELMTDEYGIVVPLYFTLMKF